MRVTTEMLSAKENHDMHLISLQVPSAKASIAAILPAGIFMQADAGTSARYQPDGVKSADSQSISDPIGTVHDELRWFASIKLTAG